MNEVIGGFMKLFTCLSLFAVAALASTDSAVTIKPGETVSLVAGQEMTVTCEAANPNARQCIVVGCPGSSEQFAVRYADTNTSVTGYCFVNISETERALRLFRSTGQCK